METFCQMRGGGMGDRRPRAFPAWTGGDRSRASLRILAASIAIAAAPSLYDGRKVFDGR